MKMVWNRNLLLNLFLLAAVCFQSGCTVESGKEAAELGGDAVAKPELGADEKPKIAFVTNGVASFWTVAAAGAKKAAKDHNADVEVQMPVDGAADQKRILDNLITRGVDGVAVSPVNPENQADTLKKVGESTNYITHDSDAPNTGRLAYIGMNNYLAGRMCGQAVKEAMPEGGEVMIFVGRTGQLNADQRRQGLIDELLDRSNDPERAPDPSGEVLKGEKYTILGTRTDDFDLGRAKAQAEDAIVAYESLGCMVGLFDYNPPSILEALRANNKIGQIKVVAFDERQETLQAIQDGECYATVVQDPYSYGYKSVELLAKLARGDRSMLPTNEGTFIDVPARVIGKADVGEFWTHLNGLLAEEN